MPCSYCRNRKTFIRIHFYLGAASVIMNGKPIKNADERFVSDKLIDGYSRTKLAAEKLVLQANSARFKTISVHQSDWAGTYFISLF